MKQIVDNGEELEDITEGAGRRKREESVKFSNDEESSDSSLPLTMVGVCSTVLSANQS
jgi:hypothetical protein